MKSGCTVSLMVCLRRLIHAYVPLEHALVDPFSAAFDPRKTVSTRSPIPWRDHAGWGGNERESIELRSD